MYNHRRLKTQLRLYTALALPIVVMIGCSEGAQTSIDTTPGNMTPTNVTPPRDPDTVLAQNQNMVVPDSMTTAAGGDKIDVEQLVKTVVGDGSSSQGGTQQIAAAPLPVIYFATDKDEIGPDEIEKLKPQAEFLVQHPQTIVSVNGHADERGAKQHNDDLSVRRAQRVAAALESLGVASTQIAVKGLGEDAPVGDPRNWGENRRVELLLNDNTVVSVR